MIQSEFDLPHALDVLRQENELRCLSCNYDLRGQLGRMRRCPECGDLIDVLALYEAVARESYQVSDSLMATYSFCALPLLGVLLGVFSFRPDTPVSLWLSWMAIFVTAWVAIGFFCGMVTRFEPGWWQAFILMTVVALEMIFKVSVIIAGFAVLIIVTDRGPHWPGFVAVGLVVLHITARVVLRQPLWISRDRRAKLKLRAIQIAMDERRGVNRRAASVVPSPRE